MKRKKGQYFQCWTERADILRHLDMVDAVISWDDADDSACGAEEMGKVVSLLFFD